MAKELAISKNTPPRSKDYRNNPDNKNAVQSTKGGGSVYSYKPSGKDERETRKLIWDRYKTMRDDSIRKEEERQWDLGDKMYRMWAPERDPDDWRADIILPDGFSAIQSHMQETIDLRSRPVLDPVETSDEAMAMFNNTVFQHGMDMTDFDVETHKARNCAAIRGSAFTREEYRYETRTVKYPKSVKNGKIEYEEKEIVDFDDVYTRFIDNYDVFVDPVDDYKYANDWVYREIMSLEEFKSRYGDDPDYKNVDKVVASGNVPKNAGFFEKTQDIDDDEVEVLHYENKRKDLYGVLANNVLVRETPLPSRHKELTLDMWIFYLVNDRMWGMGIPKIIYSIMEERRSIRNMSLDRQKMHIHKGYLVNDLFDLEEDDLMPRPNFMVKVNTNGLPMRDAIQPLDYGGDIPLSSIRMDDSLKEDERRAHGIDDRVQGVNSGGTATEAAILKEAAQKRIAMINTYCNWTTLRSIGKKKWANMQFYYAAGRIERTAEANEESQKTVYKTIKMDGYNFELRGGEGEDGSVELVKKDATGSQRLKLDEKWGEYMQGKFDIFVDAAANAIISKPVQQARMNELVTGMLANPLIVTQLDPRKTTKRVLLINEEKPEDWMLDKGRTLEEMRTLAQQENALLIKMAETGQIFAMPGTPGATEEHTEVHLDFLETVAFQNLPQQLKEIMQQHILEEDAKNPNRRAAGLGNAPGEGPAQGGGGNSVIPGAPGGPAIPEGDVPGAVVGGDVTAGLA